MRLGVIKERAVLIRDGRAADVEYCSDGTFTSDPMEAYQRWSELAALAEQVPASAYVELDETQLQNPVPRPVQVFAIGANFADHIAEAGANTPRFPLVFTKFQSSLCGPHDAVALPTAKVDWEAELVVVVGKGGHRISAGDAWDHVAGITGGQDLSERVVQLSGAHPQFAMGKSYPGFGPIGPVVVSPDELADRDAIGLGCSIDGVVMQNGNSRELIFDVRATIAYLSGICPLFPGDLVFMGTPVGVGAFRTPRRFLRPGEVLRTWVDGVGELSNTMTAGPTYRAPESSGR